VSDVQMNFALASDIVVIVGLALWAFAALRKIVFGGMQSVYCVILTHVFFCGLPALLDLTVGPPNYSVFSRLNLLSDDSRVDLIYSAYVLGCPAIWWCVGRRRKNRTRLSIVPSGGLRLPQWSKLLFYILAFAPLFALCIAPSVMAYRSYGSIIINNYPEDVLKYHQVLSVFCLVSVFAITEIWARSTKLGRSIVVLMPVIFVDMWLNGKRAIVLIALVLILLSLIRRKVLKGSSLVVATTIALVCFAIYSFAYQRGLRSFDARSTDQQYENIRIDYGRDHGIKFAIMAELHPEMQILEYRGQSILFDIAILVPREAWSSKPWPYAVYSTAANLGLPPSPLGWGITTSWLEEAIANCSWAGLFVGPLMLAILCRIGDGSNNSSIQLLTILVACLFLAVEFSAFATLGGVWIGCALFTAYGRWNCRWWTRPRKNHGRVRLPHLTPVGNVRQ
jgi:hypothetical protein